MAEEKYTIKNLKFPEDVETSPDLLHSIVFYINIRSNSKYKTSDNTTGPALTDGQLSKSAVLKAMGASTAIAVGAGVGSTVAGAASGAIKSLSASGISKRISGGGGVAVNAIRGGLTPALKTVGTAAAGAAITGITAMAFTESNMFRLKGAITLAVQAPPKASYKIGYEEWDMGTMIGASNVGNLLSGETAQAALVKSLKIPGVVGAPDFGKGIQKATGQTTNPFRTVLFKEVDLRTFQYQYKFMPKSQEEAKTVLDIINEFKFHMHPEFSTDKVFLIHPSEFNIVYNYKGAENKKWHKIATCVLTGLDIDGGTERLAYFQDGQFAEINMTLTFKETEMLTRDKFNREGGDVF